MSREVTVTTPPSRSPRAWNDEGEVLGVVPLLGAQGPVVLYWGVRGIWVHCLRSASGSRFGDLRQPQRRPVWGMGPLAWGQDRCCRVAAMHR